MKNTSTISAILVGVIFCVALLIVGVGYMENPLPLVITVGVVIVLILLFVMIYWIGIKCYSPEKAIARARKRRGMSLKRLCYYKNERKMLAHMRFTCLGLILPPAMQLFLPIPGGWIWPLIILFTVGINLIVGVVVTRIGYKNLVEDTVYYVKVPQTYIEERVAPDVRKCILFKERHLVVTEEFMICGYAAIPKSHIEAFWVQDYEQKDIQEILRGQLCRLKLFCKLTTGKSLEIYMGTDEGEIHRIKRFLEYHARTDAKLYEKYKGDRTLKF